MNNRYSLPVLPLSSIPAIALEVMQQTHEEEVEGVNRLGALLVGYRGKADDPSITRALDAWLVHTRDHFDNENLLMRDFAFAAYRVHSDEHRRVLAGLETVVRRWRETRSVEDLSRFVFEEWPDWFRQHVGSMDYVTANYLNLVMQGEVA